MYMLFYTTTKQAKDERTVMYQKQRQQQKNLFA